MVKDLFNFTVYSAKEMFYDTPLAFLGLLLMIVSMTAVMVLGLYIVAVNFGFLTTVFVFLIASTLTGGYFWEQFR